MKTKDLVYIALFAAIVAVLGLIPPIPLAFIPVPITLQTLGIMMAGSFLGKKDGAVCGFVLIMIVMFGVPILAGGRGGLSVIVGPTGGYFLSWPIAAFVIGILTEKVWKNIKIWKLFLINVLGGVILINLVGAPYMAFITHTPVKAAFVSGLAFIPGDILKALLASVVCIQIKSLSPMNELKAKRVR